MKGVPHACGDEPEIMTLLIEFTTVFPTPVGMNRDWELSDFHSLCVPHACGDEPFSMDVRVEVIRCSPRLWG